MLVNTITSTNCTPQTIVIGRRATHDTLQIVFDLAYLIENYGDGTAVLAVKRSQDESAYPAVVTQEDNILTWTVSETDTAYVGSGECQLMWYIYGGLAKTIIYPMVVMRDILQTTEEPPDGYENWIEHLTELGAETQQNAQDAEQSASEAKASEDSAAESAQRAEDAAGMLVDVSATATTLEPGQPATAEYDEGVFKFGIPKGDKLTYADLTEADKEDLVQGPIKDAQDDAVEAVGTAKNNAVDAVNQAGTTQKNAVNQAGTTAVNAVGREGTTQVERVTTEGNTQVGRVQDKGDEVIASIPSDYSDLTAEVDDLTRQLNDETTGLDTKAPVILETASGAIASFDDGADSMPVKKLVAQIKPVQAGSGDPSPDNVRPISGWTGAEVTRTGKNLCPRNVMRTSHNGIDYTIVDDGIRVHGTATDASYSWLSGMTYDSTWIKIPAGTYTFSVKDMFGVIQSDGYVVFKGFDVNGNTLNDIVLSASLLTTTQSFTSDVGLYYGIYVKSGMTVDTVVKIQAEVGSTSSTYEPYTGNQISVTFPASAGTVYGGEDEVISGKLKKTTVEAHLSDFIWAAGFDGFYSGAVASTVKRFTSIEMPTFHCDRLKTVMYADAKTNNCCISQIYGGTGYAYNGYLFVYDTSCATVEEFLAKYGTAQFTYELATPIEYTHTENELPTLYGQNNIWCDTGDVEVTYPADTKLYVDNKINQAIAAALNA